MTARIAALVALPVSAWLAVAAPAPDKGDSPERVARAERTLAEYLARIDAATEGVERVRDEAVARAFPRYTFFTKVYRQWPLIAPRPVGMKLWNIFAVGPDGKVHHISDAKGLEALFKDGAAPAREDDQAKDDVRAWLRLAQELQQDGFYTFKLEDDSTKANSDKDGRTATGKVVVTMGGNGEITAAMTFDAAGKLTKVEEGGKLLRGARPKCQATKLLDPDPIVRWMAEQDLLIMGSPAKPYLDEQRAKASPPLRTAIDRVWKRIQEEGR